MLPYIKWSHRCQILTLNLDGIEHNWIKYVIDNCDCTGMQTLIIEYISFNGLPARDTDPESIELSMKKFAQKFKNLQRLKIKYDATKTNTGLTSLLGYLAIILRKNSTMVAMDVDLDSNFSDSSQLVKILQDTGIAINRLGISIEEDKESLGRFKPVMLNNPKLEYLKIANQTFGQGVDLSILDSLLFMEKETFTENPRSKLKASDELADETKKD